jgi:hypothetical protein
MPIELLYDIIIRSKNTKEHKQRLRMIDEVRLLIGTPINISKLITYRLDESLNPPLSGVSLDDLGLTPM